MGEQQTRKKPSLRDAVVFAVLALIILGLGFIGAAEDVLSRNAFLPGSTVNEIDISGKTVDEAKQLLEDAITTKIEDFTLPIHVDDSVHTFTAQQAGVTTNARDIIAATLNRVQSGNVLSRLQALYAIRDGITLHYSVHFNRDLVHDGAVEIARQEEVSAENATAVFSKTTGEFTYTAETPGKSVDISELETAAFAALEALDATPITVALRTVEPEITEAKLRENTNLIASYETIEDGDENRYINMDILINALNGQTITANGTLSVNEITGARTAEKGYVEANVVYNEHVVTEFGGGASQVTSTLYNAALLAGMSIIERYHHEIPVAYVPMGQDAMVDYASGSDLVLGNETAYPLYVFMQRSGSTVQCMIYGALPENVDSIEIEARLERTIPAGEPNYIYDGNLGRNEEVLEEPGRDGYLVDTYRYYIRDGEKTNEEKVSADYYRQQQATYRRGSGND